MSRSFGWWSAALLASTLPATAGAAEPVYFHKAGVDRDTFVADLGECNELAGGVRVERTAYYSPNAISMATAAFIAPILEGSMRRGMQNNVLRTCMADKDYRRIEVSDTEEKSLRKLELQARVERLFTLATAPQPEGKVLPR
ncbi:MAG TPA: hypothetical protein VF631_07895 [Allosphingosinicella sp.]|jgi:hypothetical protein|uniref:hypothetical protein n=1 Tax=Allosphingosinicella sp. TaxID=2823234 RepID=UPI002F2929CC